MLSKLFLAVPWNFFSESSASRVVFIQGVRGEQLLNCSARGGVVLVQDVICFIRDQLPREGAMRTAITLEPLTQRDSGSWLIVPSCDGWSCVKQLPEPRLAVVVSYALKKKKTENIRFRHGRIQKIRVFVGRYGFFRSLHRSTSDLQELKDHRRASWGRSKIKHRRAVDRSYTSFAFCRHGTERCRYDEVEAACAPHGFCCKEYSSFLYIDFIVQLSCCFEATGPGCANVHRTCMGPFRLK